MKLEAHPALKLPGDGMITLKSGVTVSERDLGDCVLCTAAVDAKEIAGTLSRALAVDIPLEPGVISAKGKRTVFWVSPRAWLVNAPAGQEDNLVSVVTAAFPDRRVHASRYSDQLCWICVEGEGAEALLKQGGFLSLEREGFAVGTVKRTRIADVNALIWRQAGDVWLLGFERSLARYFLDWAVSCGANDFERSGG